MAQQGTYLFTLRHPGVFSELYFPKRVAYQSEIVRALEEGVDSNIVKRYLTRNAGELIHELGAYPYILDPERYSGRRSKEISISEIERRIEMYTNPFFGWSTYSVEGAFLNAKVNELQDELTQVIRTIFRFESGLPAASEKGYQGIVQSISSWILMNYNHRIVLPPYDVASAQRFIDEHGPFTNHELSYIQANYSTLATEVLKWFDDCFLFTFGYLTRRFWVKVAKTGKIEDEIWATSFFNLGINVLRPIGGD